MTNVAKLPLSHKAEVAQSVLDELHAAEAAIDAAILQATALTARMVEARRELGLAATVGQDALTRTVASVSQLTAARGELVGAHAELDALRLRIGLRTSMIGVLDKDTGNDPRG